MRGRALYRQIFFNLFVIAALLQLHLNLQYVPTAQAPSIAANAVACIVLFAKPLKTFPTAKSAVLVGFFIGLTLFYKTQKGSDDVLQFLQIISVILFLVAALAPYYHDLFSLGRDEDT